MASQGPLSAGTLISNSDQGTIAWVNPGNAASANDTYATANGDNSLISEFLWLTNFGFSVPAGATIDGIVVEVERKSDSATTIEDVAQLIKAGVLVGNDKGDDVTALPITEASKTYGSSSDLWGTTWTATQVNASNFGVAFSVFFGIGEDTAYVDHIRITVHYTEGAAGGQPPRTMQQQRMRRAA